MNILEDLEQKIMGKMDLINASMNGQIGETTILFNQVRNDGEDMTEKTMVKLE